MKKMKIIAVLGAAAITVLVAGAAIANFQSDTVKASQNLEMKSLSVDIGVDKEFETGKSIFPGQTLIEAMNVKNTANTDVYVRVTVKSYYEQNGEKIFLDSDLIKMDTEGISDWIIASQDEEETVMYYALPVAEGESSTDFMNSLYLDGDMGNEFQGLGLTVSVKTEAIQASLAEEAMMSEWGVMPTIVEGVITEISE